MLCFYLTREPLRKLANVIIKLLNEVDVLTLSRDQVLDLGVVLYYVQQVVQDQASLFELHNASWLQTFVELFYVLLEKHVEHLLEFSLYVFHYRGQPTYLMLLLQFL